MERVLDYFKRIHENVEMFDVSENFKFFTLSLEIEGLKRGIEIKDIRYIEHLINMRDSITLSVDIDGGDPYLIDIFEDNERYGTFLEDINIVVDEESVVRLKYTIAKSAIKETSSIYDFDAFQSFLCNLSLRHLLNNLKEFLTPNVLNKFEIQNSTLEKLYFQSSLICVGTNQVLNKINTIYDEVEKNIILKNYAFNVNSKSFASYEYIPSDFNNVIRPTETNKLIDLFEKIKVVFAAIYISNTSNIDDLNYLKMTFYGHKIIESNSDFNKLDLNEAKVFYSIYEWLYENGETHDKLNLARNIISRYFKYKNDKWILPFDSLSSIQSAHAIYLKENVEKYIETKNKVAEITSELSLKSREISQHFITSFRNNNLTVLTYFISIFIFNSLAYNSTQEIFSIEKYYISMVFLLISTVYFLITRRQIYKDIKMNIRYFYSMKRIYKDIFDSHELNLLFRKRQLKYNIENIKKTMNLYSWLWMIEIICLFILSIFLTFYI